ncbi:MAG: hypothetical protein EP330_00625 [Deltaproteobacteria bacterium]|nr:MAG: hypothetical protein EP330_00625 [Deltaproteobacteria bacterium]
MSEWSHAFVLTVLIEVPIAALILRGALGGGRAVAVAVGAQVLTHPLLWFVVPQFSPYLAWVACAETGVVLAESAWYAAWMRSEEGSRWPAFVASLTANLVSTLVGLALLFA